MSREMDLEYLLRKTLKCDRFPSKCLLSFGGIANAGCLRNEGDLYTGVISALASVYNRATFEQCEKIDQIISDMGEYRGVKINDISEESYTSIYERISSLVNTIVDNN